MKSFKCSSAIKVIMLIILFYPFYSSFLSSYLRLTFVDNVDEIVVVLGSGIIGVKLFASCRIPKESIYLFFFAVIGVVGSLLSGINTNYCLLGMFLFIKTYLLYYLFEGVQWTNKDARKIFCIAKYTYIILLFLGFVFYFFPKYKIFKEYAVMTSICNHPAVFATVVTPLVIYFAIEIVENNRVGRLIPLIIAFVCILLAGTSKNIISIGVTFVGYMLMTKKKTKYIFIAIAITIFVVFSADIITNLYYDYSMYVISETASTRPRTMLWTGGLEIAKDYFPLGAGFGTYGSTVAREHYSPLYYTYGLAWKDGLSERNGKYLLDTYWPSVFGETGILGAIILLVFFVKLMRKTYNNFKYAVNDRERIMGYFVLWSFIALIIESLFTSTFFGMRCYFGVGLLGVYNSIMIQRKRNDNIIEEEMEF